MDYFNGQYTDISVTDIDGHQGVNKSVIKVESQQIPFSKRFRVLHRNGTNKKLEEYKIVDLKDGSTVDRIFRLEDEDPPFFIFVPFKGNDYIITAVNPNVFYIINCNQGKGYSKCLTVNDCDVCPIKASAEIYTTLLGEDLNVRLSFLCKFIDKDGSYSYKSIITVLDTLDTCEIFTKIDVADVEYKL